MALYDAYGGPEAWDRYCERQDERAERVKWGRTCGECLNCRQPDHMYPEFRDYPPIGFCAEMDDFVHPDDHPGDHDCDYFEG